MTTRYVIDVSELPHHNFDTYDPVWWGNNFLLAIETSMFALHCYLLLLAAELSAMASSLGPTYRPT